MTQELGPRQKAWVQALRSGEYQQARAWLKIDGRFCCLGVACDLAGKEDWEDQDGVWQYLGSTKSLPEEIQHFFGFRHADGEILDEHRSLATINDDGASFARIADIVEANPEGVFTESR